MRDVSLSLLWLPLAGYLLGSIPFGILLTRIFGGGDIRAAGSGNIAARRATKTQLKTLSNPCLPIPVPNCGPYS